MSSGHGGKGMGPHFDQGSQRARSDEDRRSVVGDINGRNMLHGDTQARIRNQRHAPSGELPPDASIEEALALMDPRVRPARTDH